MKSTCVSTSQRTGPLTAAPTGGAREPLEKRYRGNRDPWETRLCRKSIDQLEARVRPVATTDLRRRAAVREHDVADHRYVEIRRRPSSDLRRRQHRVPAVGRNQRVRHRADSLATPPRGLLVGRDADLRTDDLTGHMGRVAVARLNAVVVVPR